MHFDSTPFKKMEEVFVFSDEEKDIIPQATPQSAKKLLKTPGKISPEFLKPVNRDNVDTYINKVKKKTIKME